MDFGSWGRQLVGGCLDPFPGGHWKDCSVRRQSPFLSLFLHKHGTGSGTLIYQEIESEQPVLASSGMCEYLFTLSVCFCMCLSVCVIWYPVHHTVTSVLCGKGPDPSAVAHEGMCWPVSLLSCRGRLGYGVLAYGPVLAGPSWPSTISSLWQGSGVEASTVSMRCVFLGD